MKDELAKTENTDDTYFRLVPEITPAMLEENKSFQEDLRKNFGSRQQNLQQKLLLRNRLIIEENKVYLSVLLTQLKSAVSETDKKYLEELIILKGEETCDALCDIGEFELAQQFTLNPRKKELLQTYKTAMELDDEAHCGHPKYILTDGVKTNNYFREKDIFSPKHGRIVSIVRCNECQFRNIRPLPEDLARASQIRAEYARQQTVNNS